ncbi:MAG: beta-lactamase family protein, partial [Anaerolineae bacterium]|nr:beta-lactamase family protein [Anaerolineae bacterium]
RVFLILLALVVLLGNVSNVTASGPGGFPPAVVADIQTLLDAQVRAALIPGAVLLLDSPDASFMGASGYADMNNRVPLHPDDALRVGSVTKMFTATVILQLAEEGALSLDDPLSRWLPDVAAGLPHGDRIILRQMLNHTAGLYDYVDDRLTLARLQEDPFQTFAPEELVARVVEINDATFAPGENWSYCNTGYLLLGLIIEKITGQPLAEALRDRIFAPVGMDNTFLADAEPPRSALVPGYARYGGQWYDVSVWNVSTAWAAGALVSTAPDLAAFMRALFGGDLFARDDTLQQMLDTSASVSYGVQYGLGIMRMNPPGSWGHGGSIWGYLTQVIYVPENDLAVVVIVNNSERGIQIADIMDVALPYLTG